MWETPVWYNPINSTIIEVKIMSRTMVRVANRLAMSIFFSPIKLPVSAEAVYEIPNGSMKMKVIMLMMTTSAASC